ncbi:MAG: RNA-binding S4 domain-containing protein [Acidimicrobiales bacterium]
MDDGVRVDVWLWAVRIFKTRAAAKAACVSGNVSVNGVQAKAARVVVPGDVVTGRMHSRERILEVLHTPTKRVGAAVASEALLDTSPPLEPRAGRPAPVALRDAGAGRPTKRDRRDIERLRGRRP